MLQVFLLLCIVNGAFVQASYRIFGGVNAESAEFTYMVAIRGIDEDQYICGGSIISPKTVLSAAHCFNVGVELKNRTSVYLRPRHPNEVYVWTNSIFLSVRGIKHKIDNIIRHPFWKFETSRKSVNNNKYDIALTISNEGFRRSDSLSFIPLDFNYVRADETVVVSAWGSTGFENRSNQLLKMTMTTIRKKKCYEIFKSRPYSDEAFSKSSLPTALCAEHKSGYGLCYGDSGSPLILNNKQVGVASRGDIDCRHGKPSVFVRISKCKRFITSYKAD